MRAIGTPRGRKRQVNCRMQAVRTSSAPPCNDRMSRLGANGGRYLHQSTIFRPVAAESSRIDSRIFPKYHGIVYDKNNESVVGKSPVGGWLGSEGCERICQRPGAR